jgi:hypothetical protein
LLVQIEIPPGEEAIMTNTYSKFKFLICFLDACSFSENTYVRISKGRPVNSPPEGVV